MNDIEYADRIGRARAAAASFIGVAILSVQQWLFLGRDWDALSALQLAVWVFLSALALVIAFSGGTWLMPRHLRRLIDDESSRMNRATALSRGFAAAMLVAMIVFVVAPFEPIAAQRAAHFIVGIGLGVSFLSFGFAESRIFD